MCCKIEGELDSAFVAVGHVMRWLHLPAMG